MVAEVADFCAYCTGKRHQLPQISFEPGGLISATYDDKTRTMNLSEDVRLCDVTHEFGHHFQHMERVEDDEACAARMRVVFHSKDAGISDAKANLIEHSVARFLELAMITRGRSKRTATCVIMNILGAKEDVKEANEYEKSHVMKACAEVTFFDKIREAYSFVNSGTWWWEQMQERTNEDRNFGNYLMALSFVFNDFDVKKTVKDCLVSPAMFVLNMERQRTDPKHNREWLDQKLTGLDSIMRRDVRRCFRGEAQNQKTTLDGFMGANQN